MLNRAFGHSIYVWPFHVVWACSKSSGLRMVGFLMWLFRAPKMSVVFFFINLFIYLFIYFWLCWVFVCVRGLSLVAASGGHSSSRCTGLSLSRPVLLRSTGSRRAGSVVVAHGPSCSAACGIFPDQGSNPCPLHWQADSQPLPREPQMSVLKELGGSCMTIGDLSSEVAQHHSIAF